MPVESGANRFFGKKLSSFSHLRLRELARLARQCCGIQLTPSV
jgi:hypothetical protein